MIGDQLSCGVSVAGFEGRDDVEVVLRDTRIAPRRVAQHVVHLALHPEVVVGLQQVLVTGHVEQVVVEDRVGVGVGRGVDKMLTLHVRHRRLGHQSVPGQLLRGQPADGQLERAQFERLPSVEDGVGGEYRRMILADDILGFDQRGDIGVGHYLLSGNRSRVTCLDESGTGIQRAHRNVASCPGDRLTGDRTGQCGVIDG